MRVLLRPNFKKNKALELTKQLTQKLVALKIIPMVAEDDFREMGAPVGCIAGTVEELLADCQMIITVGGDGTVLNEVGNAVKADCPILGINVGRIGFLTQLEPCELDELERLITGKYRLSSRMLLKATVRKEKKEQEFLALNDIVLKRHGHNTTLLDIFVYDEEKQLVLSQRADGLIFSTATGSTAYSLSAGGPVLSPEMNGIILSSICPHNTFRASLVLDSEKEYIAVEKHDYDNWGFCLGIDGNWLCQVDEGESVKISRSNIRVNFVDFQKRSFYENLNMKLSHG